ncbi:indoleacetamide hydrolase [Alcaligenes sp. Marseille-Q7550]
MTLTQMTATELLDGLEQGRFSALELADALLAQSEKMKSLGGLSHLDADLFRRQATESDRRRSLGRTLPLDGIPLALKDNINTCDMPTTSGTGALHNRVPPCDAEVVSRLRAAGAVLPAKAVMHELAFGITSNNATTGPARNPYDPARIPGGSSGGTATVVAARQFPAGIGTDTGASVRLPAALCGLYGFRPSVGRYPGRGIIPLSRTRDTAGPMARSLADIALLDAVMSGQRLPPAETPKPSELRLGVPRSTFWQNLESGVADAAERVLNELQGAGITLVEVDLAPLLEINRRVGMPVAQYETLQGLPAYLAENGYDISLEDLIQGINSPDVKALFHAMISSEHAVSESTYQEALQVHRPLMQRAYADLLQRFQLDGLAFPTSPLTARPIGEDETVELNGRRIPTFPAYIAHTDLGSNLGAPGISLPIGLASGLPVGLEIEAGIGADEHLLALCRALDPLLTPTPAPVC